MRILIHRMSRIRFRGGWLLKCNSCGYTMTGDINLRGEVCPECNSGRLMDCGPAY